MQTICKWARTRDRERKTERYIDRGREKERERERDGWPIDGSGGECDCVEGGCRALSFWPTFLQSGRHFKPDRYLKSHHYSCKCCSSLIIWNPRVEFVVVVVVVVLTVAPVVVECKAVTVAASEVEVVKAFST